MNERNICSKILKEFKLGEELEEIGGWIHEDGKLTKVIEGYGFVNILDEELGIPEDVIGTFHSHPFSGLSPKAPKKLDFSKKDIESFKNIDNKIRNLAHFIVGEDGCIVYYHGKKKYISV